jgi:L-asparaginase
MASRPDGSGVTPTLSADDLVAAVPQLQDIAEISPRTLTSIPGANLTPHDLFSVADEIVADRCEPAGVLIVQGTVRTVTPLAQTDRSPARLLH